MFEDIKIIKQLFNKLEQNQKDLLNLEKTKELKTKLFMGGYSATLELLNKQLEAKETEFKNEKITQEAFNAFKKQVSEFNYENRQNFDAENMVLDLSKAKPFDFAAYLNIFNKLKQQKELKQNEYYEIVKKLREYKEAFKLDRDDLITVLKRGLKKVNPNWTLGFYKYNERYYTSNSDYNHDQEHFKAYGFYLQKEHVDAGYFSLAANIYMLDNAGINNIPLTDGYRGSRYNDNLSSNRYYGKINILDGYGENNYSKLKHFKLLPFNGTNIFHRYYEFIKEDLFKVIELNMVKNELNGLNQLQKDLKETQDKIDEINKKGKQKIISLAKSKKVGEELELEIKLSNIKTNKKITTQTSNKGNINKKIKTEKQRVNNFVTRKQELEDELER